MAVQENLIEGVTDGRGRLDQKEHKCDNSLYMLGGDGKESHVRLTMKPLMMNSLLVIEA